MFDVIFKPTKILIEKFKRKVYGKTFYCPVCHLELSFHDADKDGLLVCPLCGIIIEITDVFGHPLPVVHDVEIKRYQPKMRVHPLSTHIPIGLFPFALLSTFFIFIVSFFDILSSKTGFLLDNSFFQYLPSIKKMADLFLIVSIIFSLFSFASGYYDWYWRYEKRKYRIISVKIYFSIFFIILGTLAFGLQISGLIFNHSGFFIFQFPNLLLGLVYFLTMFINMILLITIGHLGGLLVFGK